MKRATKRATKRAPSCYGAERDLEIGDGCPAFRAFLFAVALALAVLLGWQAGRGLFPPAAAQAQMEAAR